MAKHRQRTRVILGGTDMSAMVTDVTLKRDPNQPELVRLEWLIDRLAVDEDGVLVIHLDTPQEF